MSVVTEETTGLWREESTPAFGGPHGVWGLHMTVEVGDGTGGTASHRLLAPMRGLYVIDTWWFETNTAAEGVRILTLDPSRRVATENAVGGGFTEDLKGAGLGFGIGASNTKLYAIVKAAGGLLIKAERTNVSTETSRFVATGRFWDLALIRMRDVPINWPQ